MEQSPIVLHAQSGTVVAIPVLDAVAELLPLSEKNGRFLQRLTGFFNQRIGSMGNRLMLCSSWERLSVSAPSDPFSEAEQPGAVHHLRRGLSVSAANERSNWPRGYAC